MRRLWVRTFAVLAVVSMVVCLAGCPSQVAQSLMKAKHGPKIVLQVDPKPGDAWPSSTAARATALERMRLVLERRSLALPGVTNPSVSVEGNDKLVVELPGVKDTSAAVGRLAQSGLLEFYYVKDISTRANPLGKWRMDIAQGDEKSYTFTGPKGETLNSAKPSDMQTILTKVVGAPKVKPVLTGADLMQNTKSSFKTQSNEPIIEIEFNRSGAATFSDFTGTHVGSILAIFYNGRLITAPTVRDKIANGKAEISGFSSLKEATDIATLLNAGALPVHLKFVEMR